MSPDAAPTEAPRGITPETGLEQAHQVSTEANGIAAIERAMPGAIEGLGVPERLAGPVTAAGLV